jgi:TonB-linked SusC/RagA family outer membrane protein
MKIARIPMVFVMAALCAAVSEAQTGTLTGRVTETSTGAPVRGAQVLVAGTTVGTVADANGEFRIAGVPPGTRELRARMLGYQPAAVTFTLTPGGTATVNMTLSPSATALDAVVVTGAVGDTRRRAVGNAVASVNVEDVVARAPVSNITDVLQSKTPGLTLMPGSGTAGTSTNYRLRGAGSLYAGNSPVIYVDGVRVSDRSQGNYTVFGQSTSALDAINPNDIESIEVIKGPAAATLYGAEAAAGVIQIITKRGRAGRTMWEARTEFGTTEWPDAWKPVNYGVATAARINDPVNYPGYQGLQEGDIISHRVLSEPGALRVGDIRKYSLSASGGSDRYTYFLSTVANREEGVNLNNFANLDGVRGNFSFVPSDKLTFATTLDYSRHHVRLPLNDNIAFGLVISSWLATPGRKYAYPAGLNYSQILPEVANTYDNQTRSDRFILGATTEYRPFRWLSNRVRVGLDMNVGRAELYFAPQPPGLNPFSARASFELDNTKGFLAQGRPINKDFTFNYDASATYELSPALVFTTSAGAQYLSNTFRRTDAYGQDLGATGIRSIARAAVTTSSESFSEQKSLGLYVQEQVAWNDRLFVTGAVRIDNNSAFGSELNRVFYPKASVSWVVSEESFFALPTVDDLRLRFAWGQAGNSPGPFDALQSYTTSVVTMPTTTASALRYGSFGNPDLKPERGSEIEAGFEATLLGGRATVDFTYYDKTTKDALLPVAVPPSTGFAGTRLENLGTIANNGVELLATVVPLQWRPVTITSTFTLATNHNELVSFGDERNEIIFGDYAPVQRYQEGFPLGAYWAQRVQRNPDGSVVKNAAGQPMIDPVSVYMGPSVPTRELGFSTTVTVFERLRFYGLLDHKGGHYQFNVKDWRRDRAGLTWETVNPEADPDEVAVRRLASQNYLHIQPADFVKLRELSVSYDVPERLLGGVADALTVTFAGRNLRTWTDYGGADPEVNFNGGSATFNRNDSWTVPNTRRYSLSFAARF